MKKDNPLRGRVQREVTEAQSEADTHILKAVTVLESEEESSPDMLRIVTASLQDAVAAMTRRDHYAKLLED